MYLKHSYVSGIGNQVEERAIGKTVAAWQESVQVMSDIWEYLWTGVEYNSETGDFERFYCGHDEPVIDAPESMIVNYKAHKEILSALDLKIRELAYWVSDAEKTANELRHGCMVKVVRGRKVAKGTEGVVLKTGLSQYGTWVLMGIGEKGEDGKYSETAITTPRNLEVIPDADTLGNIAAMRAEIDSLKEKREVEHEHNRAANKLAWDEAQIKAMGDC